MNPNNGNRGQGNGQSQPTNRRPLTPEQIRIRRERIRQRKRIIWRNRIILGAVALLILILLVLLVVFAVKGIARAVSGGTNKASQVSTSEQENGESAMSALIEPKDTEPAETEPVYTLDFQANLSDYERYMDPADRDAYLILVNRQNMLDESYVPENLTDVVNTRKDGRDTQKMVYTAEKALEAMYLELQAQGFMTAATPSGYPLSVTSAYRSYSIQTFYFNTYVSNEMNRNSSLTREQAEEIVRTYSCPAGESEHQTGLCCDMHFLASADISFANYDVAKWLEENAWKFGFILRFPSDKTEETGISYEPWHFRFVGRYHAYRMHESNQCLEEYVASMNQK